MLAKLLKRKESRQTIPVDSSTTVQVQDPQEKTSNNGVQQPMLQYRYQRPDLLGKVSKKST